MIRLRLFFALLCFFTIGIAQPTLANEQRSQIVVQGEGKVELVLNKVKIQYSFTFLARDVSQAQKNVSERHRRVLHELERKKVKRNNIDDSEISIFPVYEWQKQKRVYKGVRYTRTTTIKNLGPAQASEVVASLIKNKVDTLNQPQLYSDKVDSTKKIALGKASKDALEKAQIMAVNTGVKPGKIIRLEEINNFNRPQPQRFLQARAMMETISAEPEVSPIAETTSTVISRVRLVIEIK